MVIKEWISDPSPGIGAGKLQNGFQVVYVGATLNVGTLNDIRWEYILDPIRLHSISTSGFE